MTVTVTGLHVYPVKGCQGVSVRGVPVTQTGLLLDRHWMIIKEANGRFLTQRGDPQLSQIETKLPEEIFVRGGQGAQQHACQSQEPLALELCVAGRESVAVPLQLPAIVLQGGGAGGSIPQGAGLRSGMVWEWTGCCWDEGDSVAAWLSDFIGHPVRLVRFVGDTELATTPAGAGPSVRAVDAAYAPDNTVAFADGYPLLLATEASRRRLEEEAKIPLSMARFRPNIVVDGEQLPPFQEDMWSEVALSGPQGSVSLKLVKPCSRCPVPNIDPATGTSSPETTAALKALRTGEAMDAKAHMMHPKGGWQRKVYFGWNSIAQDLGAGYVQVGDRLEVVAER